jgi:uncharacterized protein YukE
MRACVYTTAPTYARTCSADSIPRYPASAAGRKEGVVTVQAPGNFNDGNMTIRVDPNLMYQLATVNMKNSAQTLMDAVNGTVQTWNNLKVGWVGTSADEAQAFNDQWTRAVNSLFGSQADPTSGVLQKIANGTVLASINYGEAEDTVVNNFMNVANSVDLGSVIGLSQAQPGSPARNQTQGVVTEETFPSATPYVVKYNPAWWNPPTGR